MKTIHQTPTTTKRCSDFPCNCAGEGDVAVMPDPNTGRYYITMGHCGFNSPANNAQGYRTAGQARYAIRYYQLLRKTRV